MSVDGSSNAGRLLPGRCRVLHLLLGVTTALLASILLASDAGAATYDLRPQHDVSSEWNKTWASSAAGALDDAVVEPTAVSSADYIWAGAEGRTTEVALQNHVLGSEPSNGQAWFYANTGDATELRAEVIWNGVVRGAVTIPAYSAFKWHSVNVTPPDQSAVDDLSIRFITVSGTDSNVRAAYFRLTTTADASLPEQCDSGFGSFGVGRWPSACWRPYADSSPFNTPIPATARIAPNSAAVVSRLASFGSPDRVVVGTADTSQDWSHPTYYSQPTDPLYTLRCTAPWGTCPLEGMRIRVPGAARQAGGSDAHMTIIDQADGWEYPLWGVQYKPSNGGTLWFQWSHGRVRIDGSGLNGGGTAAHFGNLAGIIRAQEMEAGQINHALFMGVKCDSGSYVYPAAGSGRACWGIDAPPMGARLQLNMSPAQIEALAVPTWKKTILRAMATYGMYVGDTGGNAWSIAIESGSTYTSFGFEDRMVRFARDNGLPSYNGVYRLDLADGVPWTRYLRVIDPCTTRHWC